jgi:hypothetical protein
MSPSSTPGKPASPDYLDGQAEVLRQRHLSDWDTLHTLTQAAGIGYKIPKRKVQAVLALIDEQRGKLQSSSAPSSQGEGGETQ